MTERNCVDEPNLETAACDQLLLHQLLAGLLAAVS